MSEKYVLSALSSTPTQAPLCSQTAHTKCTIVEVLRLYIANQMHADVTSILAHAAQICNKQALTDVMSRLVNLLSRTQIHVKFSVYPEQYIEFGLPKYVTV